MKVIVRSQSEVATQNGCDPKSLSSLVIVEEREVDETLEFHRLFNR